MRVHAVKGYDSVLQVLSEPGCPICAFLKNAQSKLLQEAEVTEFIGLCNTHAWALAAVRRSAPAAEIFLSLINNSADMEHRECSVCMRLGQEEVLRIHELLAALDRPHVLDWIAKKGVLCLPHGLKIQAEASHSARILVDRILARRRSELEEALAAFALANDDSESGHGGTLGKAAEYLVSQRGLPQRPTGTRFVGTKQ